MAIFDTLVTRALLKWPNVPDCTGWLALDRRGGWRLQGELVRHARTIEFFNRHYTCDEQGRWFVQNGPQRVFVELAAAPFVFRIDNEQNMVTHTGRDLLALLSVIVTDSGDLYLESDFGLGLLLDRDLAGFIAQLHATEGDVGDLLTRASEDEAESIPSPTLQWRGIHVPIKRRAEAKLPLEFGFTRTS